ncbi:MAG: protein-L-isoaspartate(D-aspartate) O-methyltransferase [Candidatus Promineifilaceae bacterium]
MDMEQARHRMVAEQIAGRELTDPAVLAAMRQVPREAFILPQYRKRAYEDGPLPILADQTISQPYVVALMIASLALEPTDKVLEIGTGSGYAAAVLSRIAGQVYTVERILELVEFARQNLAFCGYGNVLIHHGDGTMGWPEHAPYNGIIVAAGGPKVPTTLRSQLAQNGRLVIPVGRKPHAQRLVRITRTGPKSFRKETLSHVRFVPLIGKQGWEKN